MKAFSDYSYLLNESLDSPADYYLTDDTVMPRRIFGAFEVDGVKYGMCLLESTHDKIYIVNLYRIVNKNVKNWSFRKPSHMRIGFSTLLKFVAEVLRMPGMKSRINGMLARVSSKTGGLKEVQRYIRFAERMVRRSFITSFKVLPNTKSPDAKLYDWEHIFIARLGVSPKSVFSDAKFKKYDFDEAILTHEMSAEIAPKRRMPIRVKTEPSKKYAFKDLEMNTITIDSEIFDQITKIEKDVVVVKHKDTDAPFGSKYDEHDNKLLKMFVNNPKILENIKNLLDTINETPELFMVSLLQDDVYEKAFKDGKIDNLGKALSDIVSNLYWNNESSLYEMLKLKGVFKGKYIEDSSDTSLWDKEVLEKFKNTYDGTKKKILKKDSVRIRKMIEDYNKSYKYRSYSSLDKINASTTYKTNLDPAQLESDIPGTGIFTYDRPFSSLFLDNVENEKKSDMKNYIQEEMGYFNHIKEVLSDEELDAVKRYTSDEYSNANYRLRDAFKDLYVRNLNLNIDAESSSWDSLILPTANSFSKMKPLENSMWVYRATALPDDIFNDVKAGMDYVDPAFLSTSIKSDNTFGLQNAKFRIYIPKKSKVIPILDHSKHKNEMEVILPPMSILRVIRVDEFGKTKYAEKSIYVTCVFVGSVAKPFFEKLGLSLNESTHNKNNILSKTKSKYDPNEKFGSSVDSETYKKILELIKNGKLKVE
jgi:hypothetical protein